MVTCLGMFTQKLRFLGHMLNDYQQDVERRGVVFLSLPSAERQEAHTPSCQDERRSPRQRRHWIDRTGPQFQRCMALCWDLGLEIFTKKRTQ